MQQFLEQASINCNIPMCIFTDSMIFGVPLQPLSMTSFWHKYKLGQLF